MIPEIAILGHPNEGKSAVLSTLAEDDSVRVSPVPGETRRCRVFPVKIDGQEVLRLTDTPGFQHPTEILRELTSYRGTGDQMLRKIRSYTARHPHLQHEYELLGPVERGAGIIYVADGARPVQSVDRAEMEILRLTGRPRLALLNCKQDQDQYLADWKDEFRKQFNASRVFNAHRANYQERIALLQSLQAIDQDWQPLLAEIISSFQHDWLKRTRNCARIMAQMLSAALTLELTVTIDSEEDSHPHEQLLFDRYSADIRGIEQQAQEQIRACFKHNIFNLELPDYTILKEDLLANKTWRLLGLNQRQLAVIGALGGATIGAGIDFATIGHSLGFFTLAGTVGGALGSIISRKKGAKMPTLMGLRLSGSTLRIGPAVNISLMFVLINRALLYYQYTINWAHGRRTSGAHDLVPGSHKLHSFTSTWPQEKLAICHSFFKKSAAYHAGDRAAGKDFEALIFKTLTEISDDTPRLT